MDSRDRYSRLHGLACPAKAYFDSEGPGDDESCGDGTGAATEGAADPDSAGTVCGTRSAASWA
jgi:hypothetical protein